MPRPPSAFLRVRRARPLLCIPPLLLAPLPVVFVALQVTAEGCKNLLLAGVSATLQDQTSAQPSDIGANFLLSGQDVGKNVRQISLLLWSMNVVALRGKGIFKTGAMLDGRRAMLSPRSHEHER